MKWLAIIPVLLFTHWMAYNEGQIDVRDHAVVRFGSPVYFGVRYGTCQNELWFNDQRGMACVADTRDTNP